MNALSGLWLQLATKTNGDISMKFVYWKLFDYYRPYQQPQWCVIGLDDKGHGASHSLMSLKEFSAFFLHNSPILIDEDLDIHFNPDGPSHC